MLQNHISLGDTVLGGCLLEFKARAPLYWPKSAKDAVSSMFLQAHIFDEHFIFWFEASVISAMISMPLLKRIHGLELPHIRRLAIPGKGQDSYTPLSVFKFQVFPDRRRVVSSMYVCTLECTTTTGAWSSQPGRVLYICVGQGAEVAVVAR